MYIMCVCLFSALSRRVGALQISIIIIIQVQQADKAVEYVIDSYKLRILLPWWYQGEVLMESDETRTLKTCKTSTHTCCATAPQLLHNCFIGAESDRSVCVPE